jgi:hypothetical protein
VVPEAVRAEATDPGLALSGVGTLLGLVSAIAARGDKSRGNRRRSGPDCAPEDG